MVGRRDFWKKGLHKFLKFDSFVIIGWLIMMGTCYARCDLKGMGAFCLKIRSVFWFVQLVFPLENISTREQTSDQFSANVSFNWPNLVKQSFQSKPPGGDLFSID